MSTYGTFVNSKTAKKQVVKKNPALNRKAKATAQTQAPARGMVRFNGKLLDVLEGIAHNVLALDRNWT